MSLMISPVLMAESSDSAVLSVSFSTVFQYFCLVMTSKSTKSFLSGIFL